MLEDSHRATNPKNTRSQEIMDATKLDTWGACRTKHPPSVMNRPKEKVEGKERFSGTPSKLG